MNEENKLTNQNTMIQEVPGAVPPPTETVAIPQPDIATTEQVAPQVDPTIAMQAQSIENVEPTPVPIETAQAPTQPTEASTVENDPLGLNDGMYTADEVVEQPQIIKVIDKKPVNKKIIAIIIAIVVVIAIAVTVTVLVLNKPKKKQSSVQEKRVVSNDSAFVKLIKESLKSGDFANEVTKGLEDSGINTNKVSIISLDIDSDDEQELVAFAEDENKKVLLQLEVDEAIYYDDNYPVDSKDAFGLVYSPKKQETFWYTENQKNYTIIGSTKKIIKEEDFLKNYFALTKTYDEKSILENAVEYRLNKTLDAKTIEKNALTNEKILNDNKMDEKSIKEAYEKYVKEKEEEEKKKKEEEEARAKQEEEAKKLSGSLKIGSSSYRFGTYNVYTSDGNVDGTLILYGDLTCVHKGVNCTYTVEDVRGAGDALVPGITLSTGQSYVASKIPGELTNADETISIKYAS